MKLTKEVISRGVMDIADGVIAATNGSSRRTIPISELGASVLRVCAWCHRSLGEKPPLNDRSETHTICKGCWEKMKHDYPHYFGEKENDGKEKGY